MKERSVTLDLLRIFAALSVMSFHVGHWIWVPGLGDAANLLKAADAPSYQPVFVFWWGWIGVQIFYSLSGYLIAGVSDDWHRFALARARRLIPGAIACSLITTMLVTTVTAPDSGWLLRLLSSATLWPFGPWVDDVYWTLGMEMGFYCLVAILLAGRRGHMLEPAVITLSAISLLAWLASLAQGTYAPQIPGLDDRLSQLILLKDAPFFAVGVILRKAAEDRWTTGRMWAIALVTTGAGAPIMAEALVRGFGAGVTVEPILPFFIWVAALILIGVLNIGKSSLGLSTLSRATFPLYLLHNVGGAAILIHAGRLGLDRAGSTAVAATATLLLALIVTTVAEPALLRVPGGLAHWRRQLHPNKAKGSHPGVTTEI